MLAGYTGPLICVGAVCLSLLQPARAWAKPAAFFVALEYEPAPNCPGAEALEAAVVARLGYDPFADDAPHHVLVRIAPKASSLDGRIEWRDADGHWAGDQSFSMASGDCVRLTRTMALALAVQIQLLRGDSRATPAAEPGQASDAKSSTKSAAESPGEKTPVESTPPSARVEPPAASAVQPAPKPDAPPVFALGIGPAIGFGLAPYPIVIGRVFGQLAWSRASIQLAAEASLPATFRRADGAGVSEQLLLLSVAGCEAFGRWNGCVVMDAGSVGLAGRDIDHPTSTHLPFVDAGLRAGFSQPLGQRAFINAHVDGLVVLTRWTAELDDVPVWTTPRVAAAIGIDVGVQLR
ncbi:MAG TPA: hypothetical protein VFK05_36190 [Polyangiaceae bacterium]|nr:hypothetical protein [Polyangiaceae bacterium]